MRAHLAQPTNLCPHRSGPILSDWPFILVLVPRPHWEGFQKGHGPFLIPKAGRAASPDPCSQGLWYSETRVACSTWRLRQPNTVFSWRESWGREGTLTSWPLTMTWGIHIRRADFRVHGPCANTSPG